MNLALVWRELVCGLSVIVDQFNTGTRCGLVLASPTCAPKPLSGRRLEVLEAILCGVGQKRLAIELALAPSTVAMDARLALESLGASCRPSRVHPLLMLAATAARDHDVAILGGESYLSSQLGEFRVVGINRPDRCLVGVLTDAQLDVVRGLVEGNCYTEIARRRGTSERTIANQIASVFRRLCVSGRSELLLRLFFVGGVVRGKGQAAPPTESSVRMLPARSADARSSTEDSRNSHVRGVFAAATQHPPSMSVYA